MFKAVAVAALVVAASAGVSVYGVLLLREKRRQGKEWWDGEKWVPYDRANLSNNLTLHGTPEWATRQPVPGKVVLQGF
jgi:hypothetical protein